jgi:hypothetical protein
VHHLKKALLERALNVKHFFLFKIWKLANTAQCVALRIMFVIFPLLCSAASSPLPTTRTCEKFDALISSQGGVGSSRFMVALIKQGAHINKPNDGDGFKHLDANHVALGEEVTMSIPTKCAVAQRLLVIVGDVPRAVRSVYRRFGVGHINKLRKGAGWKPITKKTFDAFGVCNLTESAMPHYQHTWADISHRHVKVVDTRTLYTTTKAIIDWILNKTK